MTLDEAIKHAEEVAEEQVKSCKRYDDASGYSRSHNETIRTDDAKRCEKCAKEHRQLAEWLKDYKRLLESSSETKIDCDNADCNNCVNHKYCDYESSNSEISTGSIHCQHTDAEIAKSFIEDVAAVKDQLPGGDQMDFPNTFEEFAKDYGFKDKDEVYTNGSELIPVFRVKQWLEHISTAKNVLAVDPIDRVELLRAMNTWDKFGYSTRYGLERLDKDDKGFVPYVKYDDMLKCVTGMPSVTPQESKIKLISAADAAQKVACTTPLETYVWLRDMKYMESVGLRFCEVEK